MKSKFIEENAFYRNLFKNFDKGVNNTLESFRKTVNVSIQKVENRLKKCEKAIEIYLIQTKRNCEKDLSLAESLVNKELRSKVIMSQWTNKFLITSEQSTIDPITFAISRFGLNIALSSNDVPASYILETNIHKILINFISLPRYLIVGPSLMSLVHISLHSELKSFIVKEGCLSHLLKIMISSTSKPLLALSAKLCASLAIELTNKQAMAQTGCFHALFDLILGAHVDIDQLVQFNALCAIENCVVKSDSNRLLSVELNGIKPLLTCIQTTSNETNILHSIRILANISFVNGFTANSILVGGGGEILATILESIDITKQPAIVHAILTTYSNICFTEINQTHVGNIDGIIETVIRICEHSKILYIVTETANFILALCWQNNINKARVANKNGCETLVRRISKHSQSIDPHELICAERLCLALSSVLIYQPNHERMNAIKGLEEITRLCKVISDPIILQSLAKIIVPMVPNPKELLLYHKDQSKHLIESLEAVVVLKKVKFKGFAELASAPDWLEIAIQVLSMKDQELENSFPYTKTEFVEKVFFCKEFSAEILPDTSLNKMKEFRGLLFSIY